MSESELRDYLISNKIANWILNKKEFVPAFLWTEDGYSNPIYALLSSLLEYPIKGYECCSNIYISFEFDDLKDKLDKIRSFIYNSAIKGNDSLTVDDCDNLLSIIGD